jgi:hypothetical protein
MGALLSFSYPPALQPSITTRGCDKKDEERKNQRKTVGIRESKSRPSAAVGFWVDGIIRNARDFISHETAVGGEENFALTIRLQQKITR